MTATPSDKPEKTPAKDNTVSLPFEVAEQIQALAEFLRQPYEFDTDEGTRTIPLGTVQWGVYAFFDYDSEPIYVGQTRESLSSRIGRHLTGRRSDAVAKNILDPFEVCTVRVYPMAHLQGRKSSDREAKNLIDALEHKVFSQLLLASKFQAVLNEKPPPAPKVEVEIPTHLERRIATPKITELRDHPDLRIARRAQTLAALATGISERRVGPGIRQTLLTQAKRLQWLAERRAADAPAGPADAEDEDA
ncbi:GIY-YIG nuclease family protein [Hydrogenophaga sp.]|uniref:GIY-YIG nuclease family protein n=1 Tax=Hydrogenophaga sp. TaxID=1904254 RepID=UPI003D138257